MKEGDFVEEETGASFSPETGQSEGMPRSLKLSGFDTFGTTGASLIPARRS